MRASIDLHWLVSCEDGIVGQVLHALLLDHLLLLLHLTVQFLQSLLLLMKFDYQLILLGFHGGQFPLAGTELALSLDGILFDLLRKIHKCF